VKDLFFCVQSQPHAFYSIISFEYNTPLSLSLPHPWGEGT
jgi:hypothetical protein